ncbi:glyoxylate reductase/hydroxypyruvate reductase-like [Neocloeon triangulifer]|uniref:glyoxylate reductase/hydroxypyruvate reductase-like n=1 Tax=Neocloeon triangulifer TaxID=2078957 RepID=UPI00286F8F64|nr:glyoxylate reductase/hydroxypyruvate reductase-like [Neocloeon triangulifer]XP_059481555.1 glyoxylate reductase/hydroxypyruvate reductase-like [Neocloeon triangulifer]
MAGMKQFKILVTHPEIPSVAIRKLEERCELVICPEVPYPSREQILSKISTDFDGILWLSKHRMDKEVLDLAGPKLKVVATVAVGYDNIEVVEAKKRGIKVGNTPGVLDAAVAEIAVCLLLEVARRVPEGRNCILEGKWEAVRPQWLLGKDLQGSTVGIVGLGNIGQAIAKRLLPFGIEKLIYSGHKRKPEGDKLGGIFVIFDELLKQSDFIVVACPLTEETRHLFNAKAFAEMKPSAILVNIARGDVIDQEALISALQTGKIWGAALDVMTPEPLPSDHPLTKLKNCVLAPHLGSATEKTRAAMAMLAVDNILAALDGSEMPAPL